MSANTVARYVYPVFFALAIATGTQSKPSIQESLPTISLEAELERGEIVSRLVLFIRNDSDAPFTFENGSRGGAGSLDDGFRFNSDKSERQLRDLKKRWTIGTAPTVVPEFVFKFGDAGVVNLQAPTFSGPTRRAMRPHQFTIPPRSRKLYSSFAIPTRIVSGNLVDAKLELPDRILRTDELTEKRATGAIDKTAPSKKSDFESKEGKVGDKEVEKSGNGKTRKKAMNE